jgi:Calcineurin-like phosphoesterase
MLNRRHFLSAVTATSLASRAVSAEAALPLAATASFFLVGDTHYCSDDVENGAMSATSVDMGARLIDWMNRLPGTAIPDKAGGGTVPVPHGVIHAGDLVENGDKGARLHSRAETEMAAYAGDYGLNGGDGRLRWPVREVHGNHDSPGGDGPVISALKARNQRREGLKRLSAGGLHYSWDWAGVHFVALGITVGDAPGVTRRRRYAPLGSLPFLREDLAATPREQAVVIVHHVDAARYAREVPDAAAMKAEWDYGDVRAYYETIRDRRIAAALYGHTHVRNVFRWNGTPDTKSGAGGIVSINTDNASHWKSLTQAICHLEIDSRELRLREFATRDGWRTGQWTPQFWRFPLPG